MSWAQIKQVWRVTTRKSDGKKFGSRLGGLIWFCSIAFLFAGSAFLLTCQRNDTPSQSDQPQTHQAIPKSEQPSPQSQKKEQETSAKPEKETPSPAATQKVEEQKKEKASEKISEPPPAAAPRETKRVAASAGRNEVSRGNPDSRKIALTFDAGWEFIETPRMLETLAKHNIECTFFLTGGWAERNPELTKKIAEAGHEIGNHTYTHRRLTNLNAGQIADEAEKTEKLIVKLTGNSTKPYLRVPYGSRDNRVLNILEELGYISIYWDIDSWDAFKKDITAAQIEKRVLDNIRNGSIVLMHIGSKATADALDPLIQKLIARGYQPVTVSELLKD